MNRCPNCAAQNRDGAKFCTSCGFRLPGEAPSSMSSERSPFATTSTVPPGAMADVLTESEPLVSPEPVVATTLASTDASSDETGPGLSWHSSPPKDTSVPVSDEMIASLGTVDASETDAIELGAPVVVVESADVASTDSLPEVAVPFDASEVSQPAGGPITIDSLLLLARELEYGLVEIADASQGSAVVSAGDLDARLLSGALADLQSDVDLAPLRESIATAQERPRDVDVMLDLVLRADSMAGLIAERDQLKHAIEIALGINAQDALTTEETAASDSSES